jgi:lipopolysaccharide export system permease protein
MKTTERPLQPLQAPPEGSMASDVPMTGGALTAREERRARPAARRPFGVMDVVWFLPRMVTRLLFPKLVDRYILGELISPLLFGWSLFIILFVFSVNLFKLAQLAARGASLDAVAELLGLRVILASVYCLPMAVLLAGLMAFSRLSGDNELTAMQAGGIPNIRPIRIAFLLGLVLSFAGLAINEYVIPPVGKRLHVLEDQVKAQVKGRVIEDLTDQKMFVIQDFEGGRLSRIAIAKKFEPANPPYPAMMRDVTYVQYQKGKVEMIVEAERAEWVGADKASSKEQRWKFINAKTQMMSGVTSGQRWVMDSGELELALNKTPQQVSREQKDADQMTHGELSAYINDLKRQNAKGKVIRELEVERERKLAVPFAALVLALIGAPLGIRRQRSTAGVGIGLSLLIIVAYYIGMGVLGALGESGSVGPMEAAWGCNAVGLLVGLYLTWRSSR